MSRKQPYKLITEEADKLPKALENVYSHDDV